MKTNFFQKKDRSKRHTSPSGSDIHTPQMWTIKDGEYVWVDDKSINLYERIQAEAETVDLQNIIARFESGDKDALQRVDTLYFDTVNIPQNYAQMFEEVENMKHIFSTMPTAIKERFQNNPAQFWKKTGTPEFDAILNDWRSYELSKMQAIDTNPVKTAPDITESEVK